MNLKEEIQKLKQEKNAIILAHYYVPDEVQEIADHVGDSFALAKIAKNTDAKIIVFAGVSFMGESAKILNPNKKVLMPDMLADCAMAHMATKEKVLKMKESVDDLAVVCYINSTAALKTVSDVCVTSSNAVDIVRKLPQKNIFFIPDQNLGSYVKKQVPEKNIILNDGYCPVHHQLNQQVVTLIKEKYPNAKILVHPECKEEILEKADYIGSTAGIIQYATQSTEKEFVIGTELGVLYELQVKNPDKVFYPLSKALCCADMKLVTLEKVRDCLQNESNEVFVDDTTRELAQRSLDAMLELAR